MSQQPPRHGSPESRRVRHEPVQRSASVAETAGQATADCAAVCCCCSCGLINLFYFCFIKLPVGLLLRSARKIKRRTRRCRKCPRNASCLCSSKMKKSSLLYSVDEEISTCLEVEDQVQTSPVFVFNSEPSKEGIEFDQEMMKYFHNSGFGRSISRRYECSV